MTTPVITCCATDEVLRSTAVAAVLLDVPGAVVVRHDLDPEAGTLHRLVYDAFGTWQDRTRRLAHACLGCALREDIVPAIREVALARPAAIVLALPVTAEPAPVLAALVELAEEGVVDVGATLAVLAAGDLAWDACGDDLLSERGLALAEDDERGLAEVIARQVDGADVVVVDGAPGAIGAALLDHLTGASVPVMGLHDLDVPGLLQSRSHGEVARRCDPLTVRGVVPAPREGVWTVRLESWRPLHPERLRDNLELIGGRPGRSRGVFWLPTRPDLVCAWDGAGGRLSVGAHSTWSAVGREPFTRIVVTGVEDEAADVVAAFEATLLTDAELASGLAAWAGREDGYDPWLGARHDVA